MEPTNIALLICIVTFVFYIGEWIPMAITSILAAIAMALTGILTPQEALGGFSNDVTLFVLGMTGLATGIQYTGITNKLCGYILGSKPQTEKKLLLRLMAVVALVSAFISNTATVALMMCVVDPLAAKSGGTITRKNTYMAAGFAAVVGGSSTLIGSTPQLVAQGILKEYSLPPLGFFSLLAPGLLLLAVLLLYYQVFAYDWQKKVFDFKEPVPLATPPKEQKGKNLTPFQQWLPLGLLAGVIILIVFKVAPAGLVALVGFCLCIALGSIPLDTMFSTLDWTPVFVLAGSLGLAKGIEQAGVARLVVDKSIGFIGPNVSPVFILGVFMLLTLIMTNLVSNTAILIIVLPIALDFCLRMNMSTRPFIIGLIWASNLALMTPIGTAPVTMTLAAGYGVKDYLKLGGVYTALAYILLLLFIPMVYSL